MLTFFYSQFFPRMSSTCSTISATEVAQAVCRNARRRSACCASASSYMASNAGWYLWQHAGRPRKGRLCCMGLSCTLIVTTVLRSQLMQLRTEKTLGCTSAKLAEIVTVVPRRLSNIVEGQGVRGSGNPMVLLCEVAPGLSMHACRVSIGSMPKTANTDWHQDAPGLELAACRLAGVRQQVVRLAKRLVLNQEVTLPDEQISPHSRPRIHVRSWHIPQVRLTPVSHSDVQATHKHRCLTHRPCLHQESCQLFDSLVSRNLAALPAEPHCQSPAAVVPSEWPHLEQHLPPLQ